MPESLAAADPVALLRTPEETLSPVLRILLERTRAGSRPGARTDEHTVCLAIEGGGMRGAVTAGMCLVLEAAGLIGAFDRVYGVSAGALNGWATATGQAALSATHYQDAASGRVINRARPLLRRPVIDFDLLFDELIAARKPLSFRRLADGPEFRALATSLETMSLRVLACFTDLDEVLLAVRASASLPRLGGPPPIFRGERMADGALIEPIPYETPVTEGATHVLVLRSRSAAYRKPALSGIGDSLGVRNSSRVTDVLKARQGVYNRQAADLQSRSHEPCNGSYVDQIAVSDHARLIGRLETDRERVADALRLGAQAMGDAILTERVDLCWQPTVYRTTPAATIVDEPARPPAPGGSVGALVTAAIRRGRASLRPAAEATILSAPSEPVPQTRG